VTEDELIVEIRRRVRDIGSPRVVLGIGDDAAAWQPSRSARSVITTDALVEGVHFTRELMSAHDAGWRALASNLSDIAAMGARPLLATVALGFPPGTEPGWLLECYDGIAALAKRAHCAVAGGDLTRAPAITLSITVIGEVRPSNLKRRDGALPGDVVAVTGPLGASAAGLRVASDPVLAADPRYAEVLAAFRTPEPQLRAGRRLGASRCVRAMMDISDGLSTDLGRLCAASNAGAIVETVPVHPGAAAVAVVIGEDAQRWALDGGEDFQLLVCVQRHAFEHVAARVKTAAGQPLLRIGTITAEHGIRRSDGTAVQPSGWDHLR